MGHKVLKPFDYAEDGVTTRRTVVDEVLSNVHPDHAAGLIAEGYIANATVAETASKIAGEAIAAADHSGHVDDPAQVAQKMADAKSRISDGKIGAPEALSIVDDHKVVPTLGAETTPGIEAFDHDGDGKPGGAPKGGNRKKTA